MTNSIVVKKQVQTSKDFVASVENVLKYYASKKNINLEIENALPPAYYTFDVSLALNLAISLALNAFSSISASAQATLTFTQTATD